MDYIQAAEEIISFVEDAANLRQEQNFSKMVTGEHLVLYCLLKRGGSALPKELGEQTGVSSARIAAVLNKLEESGLVVRRIDPADNRQTVVSITGQGVERAENHHRNVIERTAGLLEALGEEDTAALIRIRKKIASYVTGRNEK